MANAWDEVRDWQLKQSSLYTERQVQLFALGWTLMPSDDGLLWARRLLPSDEPGEPIEGEPELRADTWEVLLASVKAENGKGVARA